MNVVLAIGWLAVVFAGGVALGGVFFGGLWLTTKYLSGTAAGPLIVILSFIARTAIVLVSIYWLTGADWRYVLVCLAGFLASRTVILRKAFRSQSVELSSPEWSHEQLSQGPASRG